MVSMILVTLLVILATCTIKRPIYGIMCYYIIRMVIPSASRVYSFSFNTISLGVLLLFLLPNIVRAYKRSDRFVRKYIVSVSSIIGGVFALTFLGEIPLFFQWSSLIQMFMTEFLPSILLALFLVKVEDYKKFCNVVCLMALFTALYGIYTYVTVDNPIYTLFNNSGEEERLLEDYVTGRLGMEGIAVGIYNDKIALSLISLLLLTFLINKANINKVLLLSTLALTFVDMFLTTQRTALFCLLLFFCSMAFDKKNKLIRKYLKVTVVLLVFAVIFADNKMIMDSFSSLVYIFDDSMQQRLGIGGSSTNMRMLQFASGFTYLGFDNILQGEGYNFPEYYYTYIFRRDILGIDYRFNGFESFMLQIIMSSGLIGVLIWGVGLKNIYQTLLSHLNGKYGISFFCSYILAIVMTDASASFYLFFFLSVLNYKSNLLKGAEGVVKSDVNENVSHQKIYLRTRSSVKTMFSIRPMK